MKMGAILLSSNSTLNTLEGKPRTLPQLKLAYKNMFALLYQMVSFKCSKKTKTWRLEPNEKPFWQNLHFQQGAHHQLIHGGFWPYWQVQT
jgi:hypothetical protein